MKDKEENNGYFGQFGGRFVPETVIPALDALEREWDEAKNDPGFWVEYKEVLNNFAGRPTPLLKVNENLYLKREDLLHTGAHKINNAIGQALLAKRLGKTSIIAETGAGQHGVATAAACAFFGLQCRVWMGEKDIERQALNVSRMKLFGAEVLPATSGAGTLSEAVSAAIRDWTATSSDSHYIIGSVVGPAPYPEIVRDLQRIIGDEAREQFIAQERELPDRVIACLGGGSNAIGGFYAFLNDPVDLIAVEAGGEGIKTAKTGASLEKGKPGVLHGSKSMILQNKEGQIAEAHSVSAGLDYPGVGPEHAYLFTQGRVRARAVNDQEAIAALKKFTKETGILPALETSHAIAYFYKKNPPGTTLLILSGRGDKDLSIINSF